MFQRSLCTLSVALTLLPAIAGADVAPTTSGTTAATDAVGTDTEPETMPPEYEPCGCTSDQLGGGGSLMVAAVALWALRRRRAR
jgi:uncharacterized protein (TIGR03382 family)